ncbi:MAG: CCA tRNA nucleotidyltransferase [Cyanobacteria bacterium J06638_7]
MEVPGIPEALAAALAEAARGGVAAGDGPGDRVGAGHPASRLALVGGAVRDLLLHRVHNDPWRGVPDLDLVAEGSAIALVRRLEALLPPGSLRTAQEHGAFGTVEVELGLNNETVLLDVATARRETYPQPGENPKVVPGLLADDLARRDFSINAIALDLASGELIDPHGGQTDLQRRQLRLLHPHSLRDDPTRLVRGARYAARLGFQLEAASREQARRTLAAWPWAWHSGERPGQAPAALGTRLRMEFELLLRREPWPAALAILQDWGGLALLDAQLQANDSWRRRLRWAERAGLPLLVALVAGAAEPLALAERLQLPHRQHRLLAQWLALRSALVVQAASGASTAPQSVAAWCALLEAPGVSAEAVALALVMGSGPRRPLLRWWLRWRGLQAPVGARELIARGLAPGPELGARLHQLRQERLGRETL